MKKRLSLRAVRYPFMLIIVGVVALLGGGAVGALAMGGANGPRARASRSSGLSALSRVRPMVTAIPENQATAFGILRRPQAKTDLLPRDQWRSFRVGIIGRYGLNPSLMRRARTNVGNVWVIPGNGMICLALAASPSANSVEVGGWECNTTSSATAGRTVTWTSSRASGQTIVQGLVPDGVNKVTLTTKNGTSKTVAVADNVYGAALDGALAFVRLGGPTGSLVLSLS